MITESSFKKCFSKIESSFSRSISDKIKEGWYEEVMKCEPLPFAMAMGRLAMGDKFPHFSDFWTRYNIARGNGEDDFERGCADCRKGYIHYIKDDYDYTAFCKVCWPEKKRAQDPKIPRQYQLGMEPWRTKKTVMIPPTIAKAMIRELIEKMNKGGVDWEQETKDAWTSHEKAANQ